MMALGYRLRPRPPRRPLSFGGLAFRSIWNVAASPSRSDHGVVTALSTGLPVVDLRDDHGELRPRLRSVAHEVGFFQLTGHGVPEALVVRLLDAARRLFALPQADKDAVAMRNSPHFRGYTRLGGELTSGAVD